MATTKKSKIGDPITAFGFKGMRNLPESPGPLLDLERQITPTIVLNADVTDGAVLQRRKGYRLAKSLTNCHSLWAGSVMLCVAAGTTWPQALYRVEGANAWELCEVPGPRAMVSYEEINNKVYASNLYWTGIYDLLTGTVGPWGITLPPAPAIALVGGDLPPGAYVLCYTNVSGDRLGGNGPLLKVVWEGGTRGIQLNNLPSGALCWITQPNGTKLFQAPVSGGVISAQAPYLQPLPSFTVNPPPGFSHFIFAFGRVWGARGSKIYHSDPHQYDWFRAANFLPFLEEIVLIAPTTTGLYANSLTNTWYLNGTEPGKMELKRAGNGAIPGTLAMVLVPADIAGGAKTSDLFARMSKMPTPVWMSPTGFVVGTHGGNLTYLTESRMKITPRAQGASLYRLINGIPQVITSLHGLSDGGDDLETMFTRGRLYIPAPVEVQGSVAIQLGS